jgi:hypothetical protein
MFVRLSEIMRRVGLAGDAPPPFRQKMSGYQKILA